MLLGSANCTHAALGAGGFGGHNEEFCLYRRLPPNTVLDALSLTGALTDEQQIDANALETPVIDDDLPFDELAAQMPGHFECRVDVLTWRPANAIDPATCSIELLNDQGQSIPCQLSAMTSQNEKLRYQIGNAEERPSFARILFPMADDQRVRLSR